MSGLISISSSGGGSNNASPIISNLRVDGKIGVDSFTIKYTAEDFENTILRHYISINGEKKEITKEVGYESYNNEFTYTLSGLQPSTNYNTQIEITDSFNIVSSSINIKTDKATVYGVRVDESNSNPSTCVTYIENAVGVQVANSTSLGGWSNIYPFNKIRMVGFKNGKVVKEIKKENKKQYIDGTTIPTDVDVMVEIPKVYWKFTNIENGYELRISDAKFEGSDCYAHKVGGIEKDFIYVGTYLGYIEGNKLRSRSGVLPTVNTSLTNFRTYAHNVGSGYQQWNWFTLMLLQILYLIAYRSLDSQNALGHGYVNGSSSVYTGGTNTKGFIYGEKNGHDQMCFLGIEDLWGNLWQIIDGVYYNGSLLIIADNKSFNDDVSNYKNIATFTNKKNTGYTSKVVHTNEGGFFPSGLDGSDNTYYSDISCFYRNGFFGISGGMYSSILEAGIFATYANMRSNETGTFFCSRLCYLG